MVKTNYDVVINGTKAKVKRGVEGAYRKRRVRREIQQQLISQSEDGAVLTSRADLVRLMQSNWAEGSRWWKPIIRSGETNSYFQANHMDVWSQPGKVVPANKQTTASQTAIHRAQAIGLDSQGGIFAIGNTTTVNASFLDLLIWSPATDAFGANANHSQVDSGDEPLVSIFDNTDDYIYTAHEASLGPTVFISRVQASLFGSGGDADWITMPDTFRGGACFLPTQNGLFVYDGRKLYLIDKSTPDAVVKFDDGLGAERLSGGSASGANKIYQGSHLRLAVSTPEGIYYAKNVPSGGTTVAWVFRVDRDASGAYIGNPIATLPAGTLVLDIAHHLGQIILSTTPDDYILLNDDQSETGFPEIVLYFVGLDGMGALGSVLGGRNPDEAPFKFLGSDGPYLYFAGSKRLWVHDGVRGGLHPVFEWGTTLSSGGPWTLRAQTLNSSDESIYLHLGDGKSSIVKFNAEDDPDTVTAFGDDETHYTLESNYFDFNLPFESKELSLVEIEHDPIDASSNQEWTVQIAADDGAFADILTNSDADSTYASAALKNTTGRRFRYRLIYQTKDTERVPLRGLLISASGGKNILEYELILDGEELLNVDNELQDPEAFYDAMDTIAGTETQITFVDNFKELEQESDTGTTVQMKVSGIEINKDTPGESTIQIVLREA